MNRLIHTIDFETFVFKLNQLLLIERAERFHKVVDIMAFAGSHAWVEQARESFARFFTSLMGTSQFRHTLVIGSGSPEGVGGSM